jgi:hypothetical protein
MIVSRLPVPERPGVLNLALDSTLTLETISGLERRELLSSIFKHWKEIEFAGLDVRDRVAQVLLILSTNRRGEMLNDLGAILPLIIQSGGPDALVGVYESVRDVCRWWP